MMKQFVEILEEVKSFCEDNDFSTMPEIVDSLDDSFDEQSDSSEHFKNYYVCQESISAGEAGVIGYRGRQALKLPDGRFLVWHFEMGA